MFKNGRLLESTMAHRYIKHSAVIKIIKASMSWYTVCLKDTKQKKKNFKNMYMYVYTHIPIYLSIHDLNKIQDLRMVPFRGKIQAFISLLKKQRLSQTMACLQDRRSNQQQYLLLPRMYRLAMNWEKVSINPAGMTSNYSVFIVPQF